MKNKQAGWNLSLLLTVLTIVMAGSAFAADGDTLLHNSNNLGTKYGAWGVSGGKYGQFTCTTCHNKMTNNIKRVASPITAPLGEWSSSKTPGVAVVFNNLTGFGNDEGGHATSTRVCQVCHSKTTVHKYNTTGQSDLNHKSANGTDCTDCHSHSNAFKGKGCTTCHGSTAASANPIVTGKHTAHIANAVYGCADCHAKSVVDDSTFKSAPTAHGNTYYGDYSGARAGGSYAAGECANVYCHTDGKGGVPAVAVNWVTGPAIDNCKACHGLNGNYGEPGYTTGNSHAKHVSAATDCVECHYATTADGTTIKAGGSHTNKFIEVDGSSSIGFDNGAKTCSAASCHADPYSSGIATTPAWGTSAGCSACHDAHPITANGPATGSHTNVNEHKVACTNCHAAGTAANTKPSSGHDDGNITVTSGYPTTVAKHAAGTYAADAKCSTASCHADVYSSGTVLTPKWGTTGNGCASCHTVTIASTGPATGSHALHAEANCSKCHADSTNNTTKPTANHADGNINVTSGYPATAKHAAGTYAANAKCSTASCHADVYSSGTVLTPKWGTTGNSCGSCHTVAISSTGPATGSHALHAEANCLKCHDSASNNTTKPTANHADGNINVNSGYPATAKHAAGTYAADAKCSTASCHADVYGSGTILTPKWGTTGNGCVSCHSITIDPTGPATGSHALHAEANCSKCHDSATNNTTKPTANHADGNINVNSGYPATAKHAANTYAADAKCSTASCHGDVYGSGSILTPKWGTTNNGCATCHSITIDNNGPATGSHNAHAGRACTECHAAGTSATTKPNSGHNNGNIDVSVGNYPVTAKHSVGTYTGTCSNIYCHSYGTSTGAPFTANTVPVWGGSTRCFSCHGSDSASLNNISTGRHKKHVAGSYLYRYSCATCHTASVSFTNNTTITDTSKHVNVQIDVGFSGIATTGGAPATYTNSGHAPGQPGTVSDSCQNIYCHSNAQVQPGHANSQFRNLTTTKRWGQTGTLSCTGCHGSSTTAGQWALSGKHLAHTASPIAISCHQCHLNGGTNNSRINHVNGLVNYSSQWTGRATLADGKCNTSYCHSDGKGTYINMSSATSNWFSAKTLDCKGCHGGTSSQAGEPSYVNGGIGNVLANNHSQHVGTAGANATCQNCHSNTVTGVLLNASTHSAMLAGTSRTIPYHADQSINDTNEGVYSGNGKTFSYTAATKTCSNISCHSGNGIVPGVADAQWGDDFDCVSCHGGNAGATNKITSGQHAKHTDNAAILGVNFGCVACHAQTVTSDTDLAAVNAHMNAVANYSGAKAGKNKADCTAAYCHSDGKGGAGATVSWSTGPATNDCKGCHGGVSSQAGEPVYTSTAPGTLKTNSHPKHVGTTGADTTCQNCHGTTMNGAALSNSGNHLNGSITVFKGSDNNKAFNYSNDSSKTCSNISCHSGGGMFTAADIQWGAEMPTDCTGCHGNGVAGTLSGAHAAHVGQPLAAGQIGCKDCHAPTITNADNRTIADANKHGNTVINYSGAKAGRNKNCSNIYCHSNGKGTFATIPLWATGSADCQSCHATGALLSSHAKHIAKTSTCANCHSATTTTNTTITGTTHIDGTVNLLQGGANFKGKAVTFESVGTTCNNISCHSAYANPDNTATWGVAATCATCHPIGKLSGAHATHMGALDLASSGILYNMTANRTPAQSETAPLGLKHGFGCANCHPMNDVNHLNGSIDVDLNRVNEPGVGTLRFLNHSSAEYVANRCDNLYCHSNASRMEIESNVRSNTSLTWTDKFDNYTGYRGTDPVLKRKTDRCAWCHGNQPTTGAHVAHAVSNHSDNIYNGKDGKVGFKGTGNSAHGNPNTTTTITCYICHQDTVADKANDKNDKCIGCHGVTAPRKGNATISNLANHVNGKREIKFYAGEKIRSKAQIRPESFKFYSGVWKRSYYKNMTTIAFDESKELLNTATMWHYSSPRFSNCSNLACHNGYKAVWNMENFNDANKCMDCHFKL